MTYKPAIYFRYPCIQINFEKSWYDYYSISFFYPFIEAGNVMAPGDLEENTVYSLNAPSIISFVKSQIHYGFKLQVLGFGIGLLRQSSY